MGYPCLKTTSENRFRTQLIPVLKGLKTINKICFFFIGYMMVNFSVYAIPYKISTSPVTISSVIKKSYNGADISCSGAADAELTVTASGGNGSYQYSIDNGATYQTGNVFSGLSGGKNYIVKVKDSDNKTSNASYVWVNQPPNPVTISNIQKKYYYNGDNDVSCTSAADGQITISAWGGTGTLQYSADNGTTFQASNIIKGLAAGSYQVIVKDANGCTATSSVTIKAPPPVSATIASQTNSDCSEGGKGSVTVQGAGGVGLYYYSLDGSAYQWSGTFSKLSAGLHWGIVKDNNGCTGSFSVTIGSSLTAVISGTAAISPGQSSNFTITVAGNGNKFTAVYSDNDGNRYTANDLVLGSNTVSTGNLSSTKSYTLVSITNPSGCVGTVSGSATITVFSSCQWLGLSSNWNSTANWANGILPSGDYSVLIPASASNPEIKDADVAVKNLTLSSGVKLSILGRKLTIGGSLTADTGAIMADQGTVEYNGSAPQVISDHIFKNNALHDLVVSNSSATGLSLAGPLDIYGSLTFTGTGKKLVTNDTLTLKSNADETAMVGDITGNLIIGKVTVERYVPGIKKAWRFLAVPTQPGQTIHEAWQEDQSANNTSIKGKGIQIQGNYTDWSARGFDGYAAAPVIKTYNSANNTWVGVNSLLSPFSSTAGGYMVFIRGDRTSNLYNSPVTSTVIRSKGELIQGDQSTITIAPKQFVAIANPYAAPLDLRKIDKSSHLFFYVWDPNLGSSYGGYQTLKQNGKGNFVAVPGGGSYSAKDNNLIQSGSAFFAYNKKGGYLTISESSKADINSNIVAFTPASATAQEQELVVQLYGVSANGSTSLADGVVQDFDDSYSDSIDEMDAQKQANTSENLSIKTKGELLVIESKHTLAPYDTTYLNLTTLKAQPYRFEIDASNLSANATQGFLVDNYLKTRTPLNMAGITNYDFTVVNIPGAYAADRFKILFEPTSALAVTINSIKAYHRGKDVVVDWKVDNQSNMKQYEVEKSADGNNFSKAATVQASHMPTDAYSWTDQEPSGTNNYYRVRSVDLSGHAGYTSIVKVQTGVVTRKAISIFPNPIVNGSVNLRLTNQPEGIYQVRVINQLGKPVLTQQITHNDGSSFETIQLPDNIAHGVYQVEITTPGNIVKVIKVIY